MKKKLNIDVSSIATSLISKLIWAGLVAATSGVGALILNVKATHTSFLSVTNILCLVCVVSSLMSLASSFILLGKLKSTENNLKGTESELQNTKSELEDTQRKLKETENKQEEWMALRANSIAAELTFLSRTDIQCKVTYDLVVVGKSVSKYPVNMLWSGTGYNSTKLETLDTSCKLIETNRRIPPYDYQIEFDPEKNAGDSIRFTTITSVNDMGMEMEPLFLWSPKYPIEKLTLSVVAPKGLLKKVRKGVYADGARSMSVTNSQSISPHDVAKYEVYTHEVDNPSYFYDIEWEFA
jgi:hypothetical protein